MSEITLKRILSEETEYSPQGEDGPWAYGMVGCTSCGDKHCAVRPETVTIMECPKCGDISCVAIDGYW